MPISYRGYGVTREEVSCDSILRHHFSPPMMQARGIRERCPSVAGYCRSLRLLTVLRCLRGTTFDVFGYSAERQMERRLIAEYTACMTKAILGVSVDNREDVLAIAKLPQRERAPRRSCRV